MEPALGALLKVVEFMFKILSVVVMGFVVLMAAIINGGKGS